jgi:hypothetical protein
MQCIELAIAIPLREYLVNHPIGAHAASPVVLRHFRVPIVNHRPGGPAARRARHFAADINDSRALGASSVVQSAQSSAGHRSRSSIPKSAIDTRPLSSRMPVPRECKRHVVAQFGYRNLQLRISRDFADPIR